MKTILTVLLLASSYSFAQNLTPEQQQQLLNDVAALKNKVNSLESKGGGSTGLKKVNFENATSETKSAAPAAAPEAGPAMSAAEQAKLMEQIKVIKANQEDSKKLLEQLDKED